MQSYLPSEPWRTGVYTVHSADMAVAATLPYAFPPVHTAPDASVQPSLRRLRDTVFVITLDWREPWAFAAQITAWLGLLERLIASAHASGSDVDADADADTLRRAMRAQRTYPLITPDRSLCLDVSTVRYTAITTDHRAG
ncbi:hypothetical protein ACI68E_002525 [Malassezia pachydermatis]